MIPSSWFAFLLHLRNVEKDLGVFLYIILILGLFCCHVHDFFYHLSIIMMRVIVPKVHKNAFINIKLQLHMLYLVITARIFQYVIICCQILISAANLLIFEFTLMYKSLMKVRKSTSLKTEPRGRYTTVYISTA
jgi:hypothetical protein